MPSDYRIFVEAVPTGAVYAAVSQLAKETFCDDCKLDQNEKPGIECRASSGKGGQRCVTAD